MMFQLFSQIFLVLPLSSPCIALSLLAHLGGEHKYSWNTFSSNAQTQRMLRPSYDGKMAFLFNEDVKQKLTYNSSRTVDREWAVVPWASQSYSTYFPRWEFLLPHVSSRLLFSSVLLPPSLSQGLPSHFFSSLLRKDLSRGCAHLRTMPAQIPPPGGSREPHGAPYFWKDWEYSPASGSS